MISAKNHEVCLLQVDNKPVLPVPIFFPVSGGGGGGGLTNGVGLESGVSSFDP